MNTSMYKMNHNKNLRNSLLKDNLDMILTTYIFITSPLFYTVFSFSYNISRIILFGLTLLMILSIRIGRIRKRIWLCMVPSLFYGALSISYYYWYSTSFWLMIVIIIMMFWVRIVLFYEGHNYKRRIIYSFFQSIIIFSVFSLLFSAVTVFAYMRRIENDINIVSDDEFYYSNSFKKASLMNPLLEEMSEQYDIPNDITITFKALPDDILGMYSPGSHRIYIDNMLGKERARSTLYHEIRHAYQVQITEAYFKGECLTIAEERFAKSMFIDTMETILPPSKPYNFRLCEIDANAFEDYMKSIEESNLVNE